MQRLLALCFFGFVVAWAVSSLGQQCTSVLSDAPSPLAALTVLAADTPLRLRTIQIVNSKHASTNDVVALEVMHDVKVGDVLVVSRHARAIATVSQVHPSRRLSRSGGITVQLKSVETINGDPVPIRATRAFKGGPDAAQKGRDIVESGYLLFLPAILAKGEEAILPRGTEIDAVVERDVSFDTAHLRHRMALLEAQNAAQHIPYATVHIYRHAPDVAGGKPTLYLDGLELAHLQGERYLDIRLDAGRHSLRTDKSEIILDCKVGEEYYLRVGRRGLGMFSPPKAYLYVMPNETGEEEMYPLEELKPSNIIDRSKVVLSSTGDARQ